MESYNNGLIIDINSYSISEREKMAKDFSEGNPELKLFLLECWQMNIITSSCCIGDSQPNPFVVFDFYNSPLNKIKKILSGACLLDDVKIDIHKSNPKAEGEQLLETCKNIPNINLSNSQLSKINYSIKNEINIEVSLMISIPKNKSNELFEALYKSSISNEENKELDYLLEQIEKLVSLSKKENFNFKIFCNKTTPYRFDFLNSRTTMINQNLTEKAIPLKTNLDQLLKDSSYLCSIESLTKLIDKN